MGFVIWLIAGIALWVVVAVLAVSKITNPNFYNTAFSPGAWTLTVVLFLVGLACIGVAFMCLYFHSH